jgi:RIO-like serine/threonine protein kinase
MGRKKDKINEDYLNNYGLDLSGCILLGEGNHGKVYLIATDRVIKIFKDSKSCIFETFILLRTNGNRHFPRIYDFDQHFIVRDYVGGEKLSDYIKKNGFSRELALNIIELIEEFKRLGFTKLDTRCRDIMVQMDGSLMIIDPKGFYTRNVNYPRHLMKGFKKLSVLDTFIEILKQERPDLYEEWIILGKKSKKDH